MTINGNEHDQWVTDCDAGHTWAKYNASYFNALIIIKLQAN